MDLYMAGSTFEGLNDWMRQRGYAKLFSQINDREEINNWVDYKKQYHTESKIFIDSGAFSVHTAPARAKNGKIPKLPYTTEDGALDVDCYIDYINQIEPYITVFVQVDHIPGVWGVPRTSKELAEAPIKSWQNYNYMRERVSNPDKLLPVFHQGENECFLKQMLEFRDKTTGKQIPYICISTNKDLNIRVQERWLKWVFGIIQDSSNPNIKTHALGLTSLRVLKNFPITSADSTSWLRTATTGSIITDFGTICVSKETSHRDENFKHLEKDRQKKITEYVSSKGYDIEKLILDYKQRELWNVEYLQNWAKNYVYEPRNLKSNLLFKI